MTTATRDERPAAATGREIGCPRCGAAVDPAQEYCLECGLRLQAPGGAAAVRSGWLRWTGHAPPGWLPAVLLALLVAAAGAVLAIVLARDDDRGRTLVLTSPVTSQPLQRSTIDTTTLPTPPTQTRPAQTQPPAPTSRSITSWPAGKSGYTVILNSIPRTPAGRRKAVAQAKAALEDGLTGVGVLDSSNFSSLHPGYWVVFAGVGDSYGQAQSQIAKARSAGFPFAYVRQITT